jgi:hypothetical protein
MKFSIRDLMLFMVIVALSLGWWIERRALMVGKRDAEEDARDLSRLVDPTVELAPWRLAELKQKYAIPD